MPLELNSLNLGDCLELMQEIPDRSIDMVLADLPYGTTQCAWDSVIPLDFLWPNYWRIIKERGVIVLTSSQPFTTELIGSAISDFKYCWYWKKERGTGFATSGKRPLMIVEDIPVFYRKQPIYHPDKKPLSKPYKHALPIVRSKSGGKDNLNNLAEDGGRIYRTYTHETPHQLLEFSRQNAAKGIHPTQKPVELFEYLIRTYTNEGDVVLDNTAGVYTTAIAAINTNRQYICIEKDPGYHALGSEWVRLVKEGMQWKEALKQVKKNKSAILDEVTRNS